MAYGLSSSRAHLDHIELGVAAAGEIDWALLVSWVADHSAPVFAGRYFHGFATQTEIDAGMSNGTGFCLWAHGEGADGESPTAIVPIQRADALRQSALGKIGQTYAIEDATALTAALDRCLAVGDLSLSAGKQVLVFLEIADGTALSMDYWAAWSTTIMDGLLLPGRLAARLAEPLQPVQPLLPAVLCAFPWSGEVRKFLPEPAILATLRGQAPRGYRSRCYGLWARRLPNDPGLVDHGFSWENLGEVQQPNEVLGFALPRRVPVRYLRWFDGPDGLQIPAGPLLDTLSLLTLDWVSADEEPLLATFTAQPFRVEPLEDGSLTEMPAEFGVDTAARLTGDAATLPMTDVVTARLPYPNGEKLEPAPRGPCRFAIRYYRRSKSSSLNRLEAEALTRAGVATLAIWENPADLKSGWEAYVNDLIAPFNNRRGASDGAAAFLHAAEVIRQPPFTPIYFAVDFPIDTNYRAKGTPAVRTSSMATVVRYFQDIHRGHLKYLENQRQRTIDTGVLHPAIPYRVGVYGQASLCRELYRAGLVSHAWCTAFWNDPWPFPRMNVWQVGLDYMPEVKEHNPALFALVGVDVDIAWGDPGGFDRVLP